MRPCDASEVAERIGMREEAINLLLSLMVIDPSEDTIESRNQYLEQCDELEIAQVMKIRSALMIDYQRYQISEKYGGDPYTKV